MVFILFATYGETIDTDGPCWIQKTSFPYLIGNIYNSLPNPENFKSNKTQSEYDFKGEWFRNTSNYHIGDDHRTLIM